MDHGTERRMLVLCLAVGLLAGGCVAAPLNPGSSVGTRHLRGEQELSLRRDLAAFETEARTVLEAAADRIFRSAIDTGARRAALMLKTRVLDRLDQRLEEPSAYVAAVDAWILCLQVTRLLESEQGAKLFNVDRPVALEAIRTVTHRIATILANPDYTPPAVYAKLRAGVRLHAEQHPLTGEYQESKPATTRLDRGLLGGLQQLLKAPLAPFRTIEDVRAGVDTFGDFNRTVGELPKEFRWEAELLLLSIEKSEAAVSALRSMDRLSKGVYTLGRSAERMPETLRQTVETSLSSIDKNKTVRAALTELKQVGDAAAAVAQVAEDLPQTLRQTVDESVKTAAAAVDENKSIQSALDSFARASRSMETFAKTADALPAQMEQTVANTVRTATTQSYSLIDHIGWWSVKLLLLAGGCGVGLILLGRVLRPRRAAVKTV